MNENAEKWVAALRSGEYAQTRSWLRDGKGYCCLGVACDLYTRETGKGEWKNEVDDDVFDFELGTASASRELPPNVQMWLGLQGGMGIYSKYGSKSSLAAANDYGKSFAEIVDIIESEPRGLFDE